MTVGRAGELVPAGRFVGRVNFARIVAALAKSAKLFVGVILDHLEEPGIAAEDVFTHVGARFHHELLVIAIAHFREALDQQAFGVPREKRIPVRSPTRHLITFQPARRERPLAAPARSFHFRVPDRRAAAGCS